MKPDPKTLIQAAEEGKLDLIRQCVDSGVDIDSVDFPTGTALSAAAAENQIEAAKLLIELGADLEKTDDSPMPMTALFHAVSNGHEDMARLLLEHRADPNAMFLTWSSTPRNCLEVLKSRNLANTSLYKLLLDYGAELPTYISVLCPYCYRLFSWRCACLRQTWRWYEARARNGVAATVSSVRSLGMACADLAVNRTSDEHC